MGKANQTVHFSQPLLGQTTAAEGARQHGAEQNPFGVRLNVRQPCPVSSWLITSRLSKLAGVITVLGGSLVRVPLHQQTVPASSTTLGKNTARFAATAVRISAHCGSERPRESRAGRYCEVQNSLHGSSQPDDPSAARYGCGASLSPPLRRLHILVRAPWQDLCPLSHSQTAGNKNPVGTTVIEVCSAVFFPPSFSISNSWWNYLLILRRFPSMNLDFSLSLRPIFFWSFLGKAPRFG